MQIITEIFSTIPGTTSAYAENTGWFYQSPTRIWNYLRVRGEYGNPSQRRLDHKELPPRTWRIQYRRYLHRDRYGTTSACAENTPTPCAPGPSMGNYLRVRGEYLNELGLL